jgi:hypothetical protein
MSQTINRKASFISRTRLEIGGKQAKITHKKALAPKTNEIDKRNEMGIE